MSTTIIVPERKVAWGAIFSGVAVAIAIQVVLNLFGAGVGFSATDPTTDGTTTLKSVGIGAALWWLVSGLAAMFVGGWVAGRQSPNSLVRTGGLHGFITWAFTTVAGAVLVTAFTGVLMGGALAAVTGQMSGSQLSGIANANSRTASETSNRTASEASVTEDGMANTTVREDLTPQEKRRIADDAAKALAIASFWAFLALAMGAAVSIWGGRTGSKSERKEEYKEGVVHGAAVVS